MKTAEELNAIKEEVEALNKKLAELTEEELVQVSGGVLPDIIDLPGLVVSGAGIDHSIPPTNFDNWVSVPLYNTTRDGSLL